VIVSVTCQKEIEPVFHRVSRIHFSTFLCSGEEAMLSDRGSWSGVVVEVAGTGFANAFAIEMSTMQVLLCAEAATSTERPKPIWSRTGLDRCPSLGLGLGL
jgi:hypothetical protein